MKTTIIGDGGWGTALALVLHGNGHSVRVWGPFPEYLETVRRNHENATYLPGAAIPDDMEWIADPREAAAEAEAIVLAVPTRFFRGVMESFRGHIPGGAHLVSVAKGLDKDTHECMTGVAEHVLGVQSVAALSGPSHAEEVARGIPSAVTLACADHERAVTLQELFANRAFRVYTSSDVVGVQLGGALKNVIAIAVGISDGLGFGDNTRAALITRGLAEMTRLGCALGASAETFAGLSGMGDLIVTCTSRLSRNRGVGERLGKGESIDDILGSMKQVAEGVWNCSNALAVAQEAGIDVPITSEVQAIIHEGKNPRDAVSSLLSRDVKPE